METNGRLRAEEGSYELIPVDPESEAMVIAGCLESVENFKRAQPEISREDFYSEAFRRTWEAMVAVSKDGMEPDFLAVKNRLGDDNQTIREARRALSTNPILLGYNFLNAVEVVRKLATERELLTVFASATADIKSGDGADTAFETLRAVESIAKRGSGRSNGVVAGSRLLEFAERLDSRIANRGVVGLRTGLGRLDNLLGGLQKEKFYIFAAPTSGGKSLVGGQIGVTVARQGKRVLMFSTEMPAYEYEDRFALQISGVSSERWLAGRLDDKERDSLMEAYISLNDNGDGRLTLDHGKTVADLRRSIIYHKPDLLILDYLQSLAPTKLKDSLYQSTTEVSKEVNQLKLDFGIPVLSLAQLSREPWKRNDKRPVLSDLRDSGAVEQDADAVLMGYRESYYDPDGSDDYWIFLRKQRSGVTGSVCFEQRGGGWLNATL